MLIVSLILSVILGCETLGGAGIFTPINESYENAASIEDGQMIEGKFSAISSTTNNVLPRFFKFKLDKPCVLNIKMGPAGRFRLLFQDGTSNKKSILESGWAAVNQEYEYSVGPFPIGEHFIVAESDQSLENSYKFSVTFDCSDTAEPNNSFVQATPLKNGEEFEGKILSRNNGGESADRDIFQFDMERWGNILVEFDAPSDAIPVNSRIRCAVFLSANENSVLEYIDVVSGQTASMWLGPLNPGRHYISLNYGGYCYCESRNKYKLRLKYDFSDRNEPNHSPIENAKEMAIDTIYNGMIAFPTWNGSDDNDWFKFIPRQSGKYRLELVGLPQRYTYAFIYLTPPNGGNYSHYFYTNPSGTHFYEGSFDAGQTYWFLVNQGGSAESRGTYSLRVVKR